MAQQIRAGGRSTKEGGAVVKSWRRSSTRIGILCGLLSPCIGFAVEPGYLAGYADAILDSRFAGLRVSVLKVEAEQVLLVTEGCLKEADQRAVEQALLTAGRIKRVAWQDLKSCLPEDDAPAVPVVQTEAVIEPLPPYDIFGPLLADPRQPQFSMRYQRYHSSTSEFNAAMVSFGEYFGFANSWWGDASVSQIGLQAAVFGLFNLDAPSADLVNADYWIGIPVSYRSGPWSVLARIYHQSSHLGDEFLLGNPGIRRVNLSYEDFEVLASLDLNSIRVYGGGGYILNSEPDLKPWHFQTGLEGRKENLLGSLDGVAAADFQTHEERDWRWNHSYQIGLAFSHRRAREIRIMLEHFHGFSPNGQFYQDRLRYTGLGIYFHL